MDNVFFIILIIVFSFIFLSKYDGVLDWETVTDLAIVIIAFLLLVNNMLSYFLPFLFPY